MCWVLIKSYLNRKDITLLISSVLWAQFKRSVPLVSTKSSIRIPQSGIELAWVLAGPKILKTINLFAVFGKAKTCQFFLSSEKILVSPEWNFSERQKTDNDEAFLFSCCKIIKVLLRSHNLVLEGYFISSLLWQRNPHFETPEKNLEKKSSLCWCRWQGWKSWTRWEVTVHEFPLQGGGPAGHKRSDHIGVMEDLSKLQEPKPKWH